MFAFAVVNSSRHGHFVAPTGGCEGRLSTNPLSYAVPTREEPIVFDMSTAVYAEGKVRACLHRSEQLPDNCILDADGNPTNDPKLFYGPPKGTILPLGGEMSYKGFGLGLLVEILGATLPGVKLTPEGEKDEYVNGFFVLIISPNFFGEGNDFIANINELKTYLLSSKQKKDSNGVILPGALDFANIKVVRENGIEVSDITWGMIIEHSEQLSVCIENFIK